MTPYKLHFSFWCLLCLLMNFYLYYPVLFTPFELPPRTPFTLVFTNFLSRCGFFFIPNKLPLPSLSTSLYSLWTSSFWVFLFVYFMNFILAFSLRPSNFLLLYHPLEIPSSLMHLTVNISILQVPLSHSILPPASISQPSIPLYYSTSSPFLSLNPSPCLHLSIF